MARLLWPQDTVYLPQQQPSCQTTHLPRLPYGAPLWPKGFVGFLSHSSQSAISIHRPGVALDPKDRANGPNPRKHDGTSCKTPQWCQCQPMIEKRRPTYDLEAIKAVFSSVQGLRAKGSALRGAAALGFGGHGIVAGIQSMERRHFHKSMMSYADHRVWQDVHHVPS